MNSSQAYDFVATTQPSLLYITGKTSTGKTTFAKRVAADHGYHVIALDKIVYDAVIAPLGLQASEGEVFVSVYKTADNPDWLARFIAAAQKHIAIVLERQTKVIIEGAVANPDIVQNILAHVADAEVLYFHPKTIDSAYVRNLTARFLGTSTRNRNGLPQGFWQYIAPDSFKQFCQDGILTPGLQEKIVAYAAESTAASEERLAILRQSLPGLHVVEI